jgi:hypothetical protein
VVILLDRPRRNRYHSFHIAGKAADLDRLPVVAAACREVQSGDYYAAPIRRRRGFRRRHHLIGRASDFDRHRDIGKRNVCAELFGYGADIDSEAGRV